MTGRDVEGCLACDLTRGRRPLPGGVIHEEGGWSVEHCVGPLGVGTLIVKPVSHVESVAHLSAEDAAVMGALLRRASQVVTELCDPEQVYVALWSHAGGRPGHIHYVVQPVAGEAMRRHDAYGPKLQASMFANDDPPAPDAVATFADAARDLW